MQAASLRASGLCGGYGPNQVLHGVSIAAAPGTICGLVGPNGAGKTTLLKALYGILPLYSGSVVLDGKEITRIPVRERPVIGIGYVPQERNVFPNLTVNENLELAGHTIKGNSGALALKERLDYVFTLFPRLAERRSQLAGLMSGGEQRMVALGIGLIARPRLLLLDEPTTGLAPIFVHSLMQTIHSLCKQDGITAILVEQNIASLLTIATSIVILKEGKVLESTITPEQLSSKKIWEYL